MPRPAEDLGVFSARVDLVAWRSHTWFGDVFSTQPRTSPFIKNWKASLRLMFFVATSSLRDRTLSSSCWQSTREKLRLQKVATHFLSALMAMGTRCWAYCTASSTRCVEIWWDLQTSRWMLLWSIPIKGSVPEFWSYARPDFVRGSMIWKYKMSWIAD